jgi:hypothetical protein
MRGEDRLVPLVDRVADRLPHEVVADRPDLQVLRRERVVPALAVRLAVGADRLAHLEVVAPAGELEAVVAEPAGLLDHRREGEVGPLAGEEGDGAGHGSPFGIGGASGGAERGAGPDAGPRA